MKAMLNNGSWTEIDTTCLFNNQYNTTDGKRIFDKDIKKIMGDVRGGLGKCKYCGAMVKRGEEEKHFSERETKGCDGCFWYQSKCIESNTLPKETIQETNADGKTTTKTILTRVEQYENICTYKDGKTECTRMACRVYGIEWFTPENTFFLKFPNGFESMTDVDKLPVRGFSVTSRWNADYFKKIGTYSLRAYLGDGEIKYYTINNARNHYNFRIENGVIFTKDYSFGWREVKTLEGIPQKVMNEVRKVCDHVTK